MMGNQPGASNTTHELLGAYIIKATIIGSFLPIDKGSLKTGRASNWFVECSADLCLDKRLNSLGTSQAIRAVDCGHIAGEHSRLML
jgi:hypothetical protein